MSVRTYTAQKAGLTRVTNRYNKAYWPIVQGEVRLGWHDEEACERLRKACVDVLNECKRAVRQDWAETYWPDAWHSWNIALGDAAFAYRRAGGPSNFPDHLDDLRP